MPVPLGHSIRVPPYLLSQIVYGTSTFFLSLGLVYFLQKSFAFASAQVFTAPYVNESLWKYFPLNVSDLFGISTDGSNTTLSFFFMHLITAFIVPYFWGSVIQRGKRVRDYVFTFFVIYYIASFCAHHKIFPSKSFLITVISSGLLAGYLTHSLVREEEQAEIPLNSNPLETV